MPQKGGVFKCLFISHTKNGITECLLGISNNYGLDFAQNAAHLCVVLKIMGFQ
jgi:hypothetical protein